MTGGDEGRGFRDPLLICVEPSGEGWAVRCPPEVPEMAFPSGRDAENAAIRLGGRLSRSGRAVELHVIVRGGVLAGRFVFAPWSALCAPAADALGRAIGAA